MSTQITTAFVSQYAANVTLLAQQKGSKLREAVRLEHVTGKQAFFDQIGATAARRRSSRHADTPRMETPHARRRCAIEDFDWADLIDREDRLRLLIDPTSTYARSAANAMGRAIDEIIVDAIRGTAFTGENGATPMALPGTQRVPAGGTGLTVSKLMSAKRTLDTADIDGEDRFIAVTSRQLEDLLGSTLVTSADFNTVRALVHGELETFLGFRFLRVDGQRIDGTKILPFITGNERACLAWQRDQVVLGMGTEPSARITERPDKNYATQVFYSMSAGAARMQETGVVEIACVE
jgi:hypothetical protein